MCGIAGLVNPALADDAALRERAQAMGDAIAHRGPDGSGVWTDAAAGLALAHRRLAIVDLTPTGAQPMLSACGRWAMSYNGEVYNAAAIARSPELVSTAWRGTSDSEVIVESISRRGIERTLQDINGMFALALWDREARRLHLIRDRLGIKPIFYTAQGPTLYFASELKALKAGGAPLGELNLASVASFLRFGYVPAPNAIFANVRKVMPGEQVTFDGSGSITAQRYWSIENAVAEGRSSPLDVGDEEAANALHDLLADAVSGQMMSDVPLGAFLSGGIDSSAVAALMVAADKGPVRTFSIGFTDLGFDESVHAAAVASHLGTQHEQLVVEASDALAMVPQLADMYDEPFGDSSQIPTALVSKLTRQHVTVALSGDGGDELFAGYNRYRLTESVAARVFAFPASLRRGVAKVAGAIPDALIAGAAGLLPGSMIQPQPVDKFRKAMSVLPLDQRQLYLRLVSQCPNPTELTPGHEHPLAWDWDKLAARDSLASMQEIDLMTYLPDDILQKVDRASMAYALEVRPPILDHRVVEFAMRLPRRFRIRNGESKWLLRRVLDRYVPRTLVDRPKMGFAIPLSDWLRDPLRDWASDLIRSAGSSGAIGAGAVNRMWDEHISGRRNWAYALWNVLMFEAWRRRWAA